MFPFDQLLAGVPLGIQFVNVAREAGLRSKTIFGAEHKNKFLLETTGCGCAFIDYDNDGWLDIFLVNGTRFEDEMAGRRSAGEPALQEQSRRHIYRVTLKAGVARTGWGQGVCAGDYDNDGFDDLYVTYWGDCALWHNNGNGTFTDVAKKAGVTTNPGNGQWRWNTGCAFVDYDKDGHLDLFVANYIDFDPKTAPLPESGPCLYKGILVPCGPPGLKGGKNILFHNNGDGTFTDVSEKSGILKTPGTYGLGVLVATSTTIPGRIFMSPTIPLRPRSTRTITTAPSPMSPSKPASPTVPMASRKPAWESPPPTTIATAISTW